MEFLGKKDLNRPCFIFMGNKLYVKSRIQKNVKKHKIIDASTSDQIIIFQFAVKPLLKTCAGRLDAREYERYSTVEKQ